MFAKRMLDMAARAAWRACGDVEPGVLVGAVVVRGSGDRGWASSEVWGLHAERRL